MKQLTIACSDDLETRVLAVLDDAGVEGFVRLAGASGNKFTAPGDAYRTITWPATVLLVPAVPEGEVEKVVGALRRYAASCTDEPCLRVVVTAVEEVL